VRVRRDGEVRARDVRAAKRRRLDRDPGQQYRVRRRRRRLRAAERLQLQDVRAVARQGGHVQRRTCLREFRVDLGASTRLASTRRSASADVLIA